MDRERTTSFETLSVFIGPLQTALADGVYSRGSVTLLHVWRSKSSLLERGQNECSVLKHWVASRGGTLCVTDGRPPYRHP